MESICGSSSSSFSPRQYQAIKFMLHQKIPEHEEIFTEVSESDLKPGDILLFPLDTSSDLLRKMFKHAAVYCGDGEVIHFQWTGKPSRSSWIIKEGFKAMKKERGKCRIYRKKGGIDLRAFRSKINKAMNCEAKYDLGENNCIHFALHLLGLTEFYMQLVEIQNEGPGDHGGGTVTFPMSPLSGREEKQCEM